ncbi:MbtH family protein [Kitasatospora sp. NPDC097643]|uniref:MbtH family protein n=1 Tax=Kitasatospora sp. NPDC097643 TaxID=3157230 RepID=UPI003329CE3E
MSNPFENPEASYWALINEEGQYSLWPASIQVPEGWTVAHGEDTREACLAHIEAAWTDMRPASLINASN